MKVTITTVDNKQVFKIDPVSTEVAKAIAIRTALEWRGVYDGAETYKKDNRVSYLGSSYISLQDGNTGNTPVGNEADLFWDIIAQSGADGTDGTNGVDGTNGTDGDSAFVYIAYADDDTGTGFTTTFNASKDYIAVKSTTTEIVTPVVGDFTGLWKNYKGAQGDGIGTHETTVANHADVDLTGQADGDFLRRVNGVYKPFKNIEMMQMILRRNFTELPLDIFKNSFTSGSGSTVLDSARTLRVDTLNTANSYASRRTNRTNGWFKNTAQNIVDYGTGFYISIVFTVTQIGGAGGRSGFFFFGDALRTVDSFPVDKGVGIKIEDGFVLKGLYHDGTLLKEFDLQKTGFQNRAEHLIIHNKGNGEIEWIFNDVSEGIVADGPTGTSSLLDTISFFVTTTEASNRFIFDLRNIKLFTE